MVAKMPSASTPSEIISSLRLTDGAMAIALLLHAERLENSRDALGVLFDEGLVLITGQEYGIPTELRHRLLPRRRFGRAFYGTDQRVALRTRDCGCTKYTTPVAKYNVDALLLQRADAFNLRRRRDAERAHAAALDVFGELAHTCNAGSHVPADDVCDLVAAALGSNVVDLHRIDADRLRNQARQNVIAAAGRTAIPGDFARLRLEHLHQVADKQRVRIALSAVDELSQSDRAGGAALVIELHRLHDLGSLHRRAERTSGLIPAATGIGGDHHLERAELRECRCRCVDRDHARKRGQVELASVHFVSCCGSVVVGMPGAARIPAPADDATARNAQSSCAQ